MAEALFLSLGSMNTISANEISDLKRKFKKLKKLKYVIIDGTERHLQKEFYSGKKKRHMITDFYKIKYRDFNRKTLFQYEILGTLLYSSK
ncbi:hypothetical protein LEP1GSC074_2403 [Leptospira noguchii str. Hook]|uniref:Uncharacterized protein n=1 Tax=Leptospira noguchii serovar Autumnalis str. ZUN142 TaxID=1085540 RepID=M6UIM6_9LEPT|nr:hypothetical protein LEP1GSC041_0355 [Leptospira noguchii str. 2006001870]EMO40919.1 hypothetical protein LEP1GSC186_3151 [Leptospira noguchii serovar Autumnalis str. ZUN142]EMS89419.1 hypothetical protein LEP1GSC074_2403 [Leptospira noguchii str. Hook]TQE67763.1 hypothetical protein FF021_17315 [Leptospira noguchii]